MAPERPTSPQDEIILTPKMSVPGSPVAGTPVRDAQSPISILLAVAQSQNKSDDDLTNLNWLHERDLLKGMNINPSPSSSVNSTPVKSYNDNQLLEHSPRHEYFDETAADGTSPSSNYTSNQKYNKHPHNIPYDPLVHTNNKPPYSFSCLIFMAIEDSVQKALPVKEIYAWILEHFPYFKNAPTGWKNSVRHNLSLNKCFQKVEKAPNLGKGSLWTVDPQYKPNLIQALSRSPFHPCSPMEQPVQYRQPISEKSSAYRLPNPELFPYLAKKLASTTEISNQSASPKIDIIVKKEEALDDVDAAAVMLSLKNGAIRSQHRRENGCFMQIITTSPSQDHTYSAAENARKAENDMEIEDRIPKSHICRKIDFEDDEERRIKEGAETLLNLASIAMRKRSNSNSLEDQSKRVKCEPSFDIKENESDQKPLPFKPRLLRVKKKDTFQQKIIFNNNNDEWVKHRRELENKQHSNSRLMGSDLKEFNPDVSPASVAGIIKGE